MLRNNYKHHAWKCSGIIAIASRSKFNWMVVSSLFPLRDAKKWMFPKMKQPFKNGCFILCVYTLNATIDTVEGPVTIFQVYAPDSSYSEDVVEEFYDMLRSKIDAFPKKTSIQWTRTDPNAPKVVFEYFYDLPFKSSIPNKSWKTRYFWLFWLILQLSIGCFWPKWSKGTSTDQDLSLEPITKSLWHSVQKCLPVQKKYDGQTVRRTDGHPKPIGPQPFGLGPKKPT